MDNKKKATRVGERIFSYLVTIKAPQDSGITITNRSWHIVVDQHTGYKDLEFYSTKSDFVVLMCNKISNWKNNGKLVWYMMHDNAMGHKILIKIANNLKWKLGITM